VAVASAPALARAGAPAAAYGDPAGLVVSRGFTFAGFWLRFLALLIDGVILGIVQGLLFLPLFFLSGLADRFEAFVRSAGTGRPDPAILLGFVSMILVFSVLGVLVQWLYFAYLESGEKQATWGKQALGLYVTNLTGNPIGFGHASGRYFAKLVSNLIPLAIGYIMAGFTERKQALHDMIAGCLVLRR
jgi:uncharacterized RDD family membrane protein YckC